MWNEIDNTNDIEHLMEEYSGFHDSCIVSMSFTSGMYVDEENPLPRPTGDTSYFVTDYQVPVGI